MNIKDLRAGKTLFHVRVASRGHVVVSASVQPSRIIMGVHKDAFGNPCVKLAAGPFVKDEPVSELNGVAQGMNLSRSFFCQRAASRYAKRMMANDLLGTELDVLIMNDQFSMLLDNDYIEDDQVWDFAA